MERFYLITSDHLCEMVLFRDDADFEAAMNIVAVAAYSTGAKVITFVLMSNHTHFVLRCTEKVARSFMTVFKHLYSKYFNNRYGIPKTLRRNDIDIRELQYEGESIERAIAYVQMNCVAANICPHPSLYPWGCGKVFFDRNKHGGRCLENLSLRAQRTILHSKVKLPGHYILLSDSYIDPVSYVDVDFVERLYRTPKRYNFFLTNSSKARQRLEKQPVPSFRDQTILLAIEDLCHSLFRKDGVDSLENGDVSELISQLTRRFNVDIAQIARLTGISYNELSGLLNSY